MILVTGSAGFIGHAVCAALLARGEAVTGLDNFNAYYDPALKRARVHTLKGARGFSQVEADLADRAALAALLTRCRPDRIVHLAAQAGVRYSFENPDAYTSSNLVGFANLCRRRASMRRCATWYTRRPPASTGATRSCLFRSTIRSSSH